MMGPGHVILLLGAVGLLAGCQVVDAPTRPNIVLISLDTVRADHLGLHGYERPTSPHLDALAAESIVFEHAYTTSSHTLPAHGSLLTGLLPDTHGLLTQTDSLAPSVRTLAEILAESGYETAAFVNAGWLEPKFGLDRGFDHYDFTHDLQENGGGDALHRGRDAGETNLAVSRWLDARETTRPFFLLVHYFDAHSDWQLDPYDAPTPYRQAFERPRPPGFVAGTEEKSGSRHMLDMNARGELYSEADRRYLESLYDAGVAYTDAMVGALLDALDRRGLRDDTVIVVVADHGEEFQEHGKLLHIQVFDELIRVPLILSLPNGLGAGRRIDDVVQITDLMPTILGAAGYEGTVASQGRDLGPLIVGEDLPSRPVISRNQSGSQYALREGRFKVVQRSAPAAFYLFALDEDPGETTSIAKAEVDVAMRLRQKLAAIKKRARAARPAKTDAAPLSEDVRRSLESLGYVVE